MKNLPIVTLCLTSYNRREKLKNCIESFLKTNLYPIENIEIVIVDNGSDDKETVDFIERLDIKCFGVKKHFNEKNDYPFCLRRAKNQARALASGEYFIDCPDDHLFVVKTDWITNCIEYIAQEKNTSCVCHYAYPEYRFSKPNNKMKRSSVDASFYVSELKGYADYHIMKRQTYEKIGHYREDLAFTPNAESEYMDRSYGMGYRRSMPLVPVSIINEQCYSLTESLSLGEVNQVIPLIEQNRPISNETLTIICKKLNKIS